MILNQLTTKGGMFFRWWKIFLPICFILILSSSSSSFLTACARAITKTIPVEGTHPESQTDGRIERCRTLKAKTDEGIGTREDWITPWELPIF